MVTRLLTWSPKQSLSKAKLWGCVWDSGWKTGLLTQGMMMNGLMNGLESNWQAASVNQHWGWFCWTSSSGWRGNTSPQQVHGRNRIVGWGAVAAWIGAELHFRRTSTRFRRQRHCFANMNYYRLGANWLESIRKSWESHACLPRTSDG